MRAQAQNIIWLPVFLTGLAMEGKHNCPRPVHKVSFACHYNTAASPRWMWIQEYKINYPENNS